MAEVNWDEVRMDYITSDLSQRDLIAKYKVAAASLRRRSSEEGWVEARKEYRHEVIAKAAEKSAEKRADELVRLVPVLERAIAMAEEMFRDDQQFKRYIVERRERYASPVIEYVDGCDDPDDESQRKLISEKQWSEEKLYGKVDTKAFNQAVTTLEKLVNMVRDLFGIPTQVQEENQRIAAARLELEQKKASADNNAPGAIVVRFAAGKEDWNQ